MESAKYRLLYYWLLWFFVIHTTSVAVSLIVVPGDYLVYFGFGGYQGRFFQVQAGVFHLVMGVAYLLAIYHGEEEPWLVYFAVIAKLIAFVFLVLYFMLMEQNWVIIVSAFADGVMGFTLFFLYRRFKKKDVIRQ